MKANADTCALCPRLCRHRCPVSIATGIESATPTAIMTQLVLSRGNDNTHVAQAIDLCTRCGQCEDACGVDQTVIALLDHARTKHQPRPDPWVSPEIHGTSDQVAVICGDFDWTPTLSTMMTVDLSHLHTSDHLGELHRIRTDTIASTLQQLGALFQERTAITSCHTCRIALEEAGVTTTRLSDLLDDQSAAPRWRTCQCEPGTGLSTLVTCCGARAPLSTSHPTLATSVARDVKRRLDGQAVYIEDSRCSAHLRAVGANTTDAVNRLKTMETPDANR